VLFFILVVDSIFACAWFVSEEIDHCVLLLISVLLLTDAEGLIELAAVVAFVFVLAVVSRIASIFHSTLFLACTDASTHASIVVSNVPHTVSIRPLMSALTFAHRFASKSIFVSLDRSVPSTPSSTDSTHICISVATLATREGLTAAVILVQATAVAVMYAITFVKVIGGAKKE